MALRRHVVLSVGRPPGRDWKRRPGRPGSCWIDQVRRDSKPHQWNSGGMQYDMVMMLERRNGPRRLHDHDDDVSKGKGSPVGPSGRAALANVSIIMINTHTHRFIGHSSY